MVDGVGKELDKKLNQWVQTDRKTHEAWARLVLKKPRAAALAHQLVAMMGDKNAVVISQALLAKLLGCSTDTISRAVRDLVSDNWITVVRIGKGKECAYVVNDRVGWAESRNNLRLSKFSAEIIVDRDDQDESLLGSGELRQIPTILSGEQQLPSGSGLEPPSQQFLPDLEPDLPVRDPNTLDFVNGAADSELKLAVLSDN